MLPGHLKSLFKTKAPLYREPVDYPLEKRCTKRISGVSEYLAAFREAQSAEQPPVTKTRLQEKKEALLAKQQENKAKLADAAANWNPKADPLVKGDPFSTLFVGRLRYTIDETDLDREFAKYGPIERVRVVRDHKDQSRGYAFVVFQQESDAQRAKREAMGLLLKGRRIITDFERGRTQSSWKPRRLGGGRGGRDYAKQMLEESRRKQRPPPREPRRKDPRSRDYPPRDYSRDHPRDHPRDYPPRNQLSREPLRDQRRDPRDFRERRGPIRTEQGRVLRKY